MKIPERFLLIDDDPSNNLLTKMSIKKVINDADVVVFTAPEEGLEYINSEYQANAVSTLLLLDINMPKLSGWDVLDQLAEISELVKQNIKIYILSSSIDPTDREKAAKNSLVSGYLEKPLDRNTLRTMFSLS